MAFDANKMRELMESKQKKEEPVAQPEEGTSWVQDRKTELNAEMEDSTLEDSYTFDPEESRPQFEALGNLAVTVAKDTIAADIEYSKAEAYAEATGGEAEEEALEKARVNAIRAPFKEPSRQFISAYADNANSPFQRMAQGLRQSSANIEYFMTDEERIAKAREIGDALHIPAAALLSDTEAMQNAMSAYDYEQKIIAAGGSMEKVYEDFPKLKEIAGMDAQGAALALHDLHHVREARNAIDAFFEGWKRGNDNYDYGILKTKEALGEATDEDKARIAALEKSLKETEQYVPSFFVNPAVAMASGAESLPEMLYSSAKAIPYAVTGGVVGTMLTTPAAPVTGGASLPAGFAVGAKKGFDLGLLVEMGRPMAGRKFAEYQDMTDENGNRLMTDEQAWERAVMETIPEALIEVGGFKMGFGKAAMGAHAKKVISEAMQGVTKPTAKRAALGFLGAGVKGTLETGVSEMTEEFGQKYPDALMEADIRRAAKTGDMDFTFSGFAETLAGADYGDITQKAIAQGIEAAPGSFFLGGISAVGGAPMGGVRYGLSQRAWYRQWGEMTKTERTTVSGTIMLEQLQNIVHDSSLQETAPDVQREILRDELKETPWQMAYVDVETALKNENGLEDIRKVGHAAGMTEEEIEQAIEEKGTIAVPLECYAQESASPELLDSVSFSTDAEPLAKVRENARKVEEEYTRRMEADINKQIELTESMAEELFPESGDERNAALAAIYQDPENPANGWKELYDRAVAERDEILAPALSALERGMGNGTSVVETLNAIGDVSTVRGSNNEEWYSDFYKEHKRKPTKEELRDMARKMMSGESDAPQVQGWTVSDKETAAAMANEKDRLEAADHEIEILENIKERMQEMTGREMELTAGMTPEAYKVYRTITTDLLKFGGKVGRAARVSALLWARHADVFAQRMRKLGNEDYTAMSWLNQKIRGIVEGRNAQGEGYNQSVNVRRDFDQKYSLVNIDNLEDLIGTTERTEEAYQKAIDFINQLAARNVKVTTDDLAAVFNFKGLDDGQTAEHIVLAKSGKSRSGKPARTARNLTVSNPADILNHAILVEVQPTKHSEGPRNKKDRKTAYSFRFVVPVLFQGKPQALVITSEGFNDNIFNKLNDVALYEVYNKKIPLPGANAGLPENGTSGDFSSDEFSLSELLANVKDLNGKPYVVDGQLQFENDMVMDVLNQFAGENALTADTVKLAKAQEMQESGKSAEDIYKETGWLQGQDGKWRYEIPDNLDKIDLSELKEARADAFGFSLARIYDNPALYEAYPWLQNIPVVKASDMPFTTHAAVTNEYDTLAIELNEKHMDDDNIKNTLIHEIQHVIQRHEGFARGGSPEMASILISRELDKLLVEYEKTSDDARAYAAARGRYDNVLLGLLEADEETQDKIRKEYEKRSNVLTDAEKTAVNLLDFKIRRLRRELNDHGQDRETLYYNLGGEQEARKAADRANGHTKIAKARRRFVDAEIAFEQLIDSLPEDERKQVDEFLAAHEAAMEANREEELHDGMPEEEQYTKARKEAWDKEGDLEAALPENVLDAWHELGNAEWALSFAEDALQQLPRPHDINAIIIFGGESIPYEQEPKILDVLNQSAWHGSPHTFEKFDLGAIGTGEGAQAHGWGLYFAKDRKISEMYKERLSTRHGIDYAFYIDGKRVGQDVENALHDILGGNTIYRAAEGEITLQSAIEETIDFQKQWIEKCIEKEIADECSKALSLIEDNPKISIKKFLEETKQSDQYWRFKNAAESARANAKKENRRATIKDVADVIKTEEKIFSEQVDYYRDRLRFLENVDAEKISVRENHGSLFEVEIPNDDVLLDEQKTFAEQPESVKKSLEKLRQDFAEDKIPGIPYVYIDESMTGRDIYRKIQGELQSTLLLDKHEAAQMTSELLNKYGIEGITYTGGRDGRCYVVFDDKAISIIESYNQENNGGRTIQGRTIPYSDGKRLVELFETADESTFMHESGHIFLMDLEALAKMGDEDSAADLKVVNKWAQWQEGDAKKYRDTPWAKEFAEREQAIKTALKTGVYKKKDGTTKTAEQLLREWRQERFARAFELYLKEGQAPSKGLRKVFEKFVTFLTQIYQAFSSDGVRASADVEAIMGRILATEDEIRAMETDDRYSDFMKAGGEQILNESAQETFARWSEEAKQEAREKLRKIVMRDLKGKAKEEREEILRAERERKETELSNQPVYLARQAIQYAKDKNAWNAFFPTEEAWKKADAETPQMKDALDSYMQTFEQGLDKKKIEDALTEDAIEKAMSSAEYHVKLLRMEQSAFAAKSSAAKRLSGKARATMEGAKQWIDSLPDGEKLAGNKTFARMANSLKLSGRWSAEELAAIDKMAKAATKEDALKALGNLRKLTQERKVGLSDLRDANEGKTMMLRKMAKAAIERQPIMQSTQVQTHRKAEKDAAREAKRAASRGNWQAAAQAKERELLAAFMAAEAEKVRGRVQTLLKKIKTQLTAKTKLPKDERYWHSHIAYLLRVAENDAVKPEVVQDISSIAKSLGDGLDVATDENGQSNILNLMLKLTDSELYKNGYHGMTLSEFEDAADVLTVLYTTGKDKFNLKTTQGKTVRDVVEEIVFDDSSYNKAKVTRSTITGHPNRGGVFWSDWLASVPKGGDALAQFAQRYALSLTKPEELIKLLGKKAHKYLYGLYDRAAEQEAGMTADFVGKIDSLLAKYYTPAERREWQTRSYEWIDSDRRVQPVSKENILAMALNFGNDVNMDRLVQGLESNVSSVDKFVSDNMTEKDWLFCQDVWDLLATYWPETVQVEMELNGTRLKPQKARAFTVKTTDAEGHEKDLSLRGGYYPIKYDPELSTKAGEQNENMKVQEAMTGATVLGMGRGFTKDRAALGTIKRPLLLSLSVIPNHANEVIHNITTRIAARDVYRLLNDSQMKEYIEGTLGKDAYGVLTEWALDVWKVKPKEADMAESLVSKIRQNSGIAIMGYRMWPTIENATNIFPMMDALGAKETLSAMSDYYGNKKEFDELIAKSMFMKERTERMDRDMKRMGKMFVEKHPIPKWLVEHAYDPITYTDLLTSRPLWARAYKNAFSEKLAEVQQENDENTAAFEKRRAEYDEIAAQIHDMKVRRRDIRDELRRRQYRQLPLQETEFTRMSTAELRDESAMIDRDIEDKGKELFVASEKMQRASTLLIRTDKEMLDEAEHRSILAADKAVREVIGSGDTKDLSRVQRSRNEMMKALTMFYSYFNTQANAIIGAHWKGKWQGGTEYNFMPIAKALAYRFLLTSALATVMRWICLGEGSDDKDKYKKDKDGNKVEVPFMERALKQYAKNTLSTSIGGAWGLRDFGNYFINLAIDGRSYNARFDGMIGSLADQITKEAQLIMAKGERDEKAREAEAKRQERYRHMTPAQRKKFREEEKYRNPPNTISYADILRGAGTIATSLTAGTTGITEPIANAVLGTMQYIFDSDGRYDATLRNMMWSAFWTKKPVKRTAPEKPKKNEKKGR